MQVQFHILVYTDHLQIAGPRQKIKKDWVSTFEASPTEEELREAVRAKIPSLKALIFDDGLVWERNVNIGTFAIKPDQPSCT